MGKMAAELEERHAHIFFMGWQAAVECKSGEGVTMNAIELQVPQQELTIDAHVLHFENSPRWRQWSMIQACSTTAHAT